MLLFNKHFRRRKPALLSYFRRNYWIPNGFCPLFSIMKERDESYFDPNHIWKEWTRRLLGSVALWILFSPKVGRDSLEIACISTPSHTLAILRSALFDFSTHSKPTEERGDGKEISPRTYTNNDCFCSSSDLISFDFSLEFVGRSKLAGPANYFLAREFAGSSFGLLLTFIII